MARLVLPYLILRTAHKNELKQRRNERRLARYMDNAFSMGEEEFRANYRVTKELFEEICVELMPHMKHPKRRSDISTKYKLLIALSFYATGSYQRLVGGSYGTLMSQQSVSRAINEVTTALNTIEILNKWIKFPQTRSERDSIKRSFYEKFGIPAVVGSIDGTHVAIVRPSENEERFFNRKHFHSRNVMIICDADLNILSVDASFGGASHDSFVWNQHPIKNRITELRASGEDIYLLGDSGYAQRDYMMTPILGAIEGSPEDHYNKIHASARNTVERTIGVLKNRWRCLLVDRKLHYHPSVAAKIINACCVLHNICNKARLNIDVQIGGASDGHDDITIPYSPLAVRSSTAATDLRRGITVRANLVQQLWVARR